MAHPHRRTTRRGAMFCLAITVGLALMALWAGAATGTVVLQERYSGTYSDSFDDCGFTLEVEGTFSGQFTIRADRDGEAFYARDTGSFREVLTNAETGEWFVVRGHRVFNEIKATLVSGTVYEFEAIEAGQPFVIEDSSGKVVVRDRGVIRFGALFDTLGDGEPGVVFLAETYTSVRGPHPGFADDFPFCEIAAELTGA